MHDQFGNATVGAREPLTLHVAGPFHTKEEARNYIKIHARERNMTGFDGLYVEKGWGERYDVRETI